ncbi:bZIP transcription factor [Aspergillus undulatus]|uniref:bZIP transcription factor n=1 Tax=Aspergillus undulatus TaxID=1810928 RepID=UPI003CCD05C9
MNNLRPGTRPSRIRDNQRRSRARRKEYIRELEERVQSYERLGVTATQEVQAAGRKVARENEGLRELLSLHGIAESQVNQYLASRRSENAAPFPPVLGRQEGHGNSTTMFSTKQHAHEHAPMSHSTDANRMQYTAALSDEEPVPEERMGSGQADGLPLNRYRTPERHDETSMSCEAAENIIVGMHNYSDRSVIRERLGCGSTDCRVRHLTIFEMLDV